MLSIIKEIKFFIVTTPNEKRPHWISLFKVPSANDTTIYFVVDVHHYSQLFMTFLCVLYAFSFRVKFYNGKNLRYCS